MPELQVHAPARSVEVPRPQRWDTPFGERPLTDREVERILSLPPWSRIDESAFPRRMSLRDILRNDCRIVEYKVGDVVVRKGDYGTSAFFILDGRMRVSIEKGSDSFESEIRGSIQYQRRSFFSALSQLWRNPKVPESRDPAGEDPDRRLLSEGLYIRDVIYVVDRYRTAPLGVGTFFGEVAAFTRAPRTASVFAETAVELLELRWQGLRDISRRVAELLQQIETSYRASALRGELASNPFFQGLRPEDRDRVASEVIFESYGDREWSAAYKRLAERRPQEKLEGELLIAEEGCYPNGLIVLRSGFARVSRRHGNGHRTTRYLCPGQVFGLEEAVENWGSEDLTTYRHSLRALGYVDVLLVPTRVVEELVLPALSPGLLPGERQRRRSSGQSELDTEFLEQIVEARYINGTAAMLIDLERCSRCDDCVRACAQTHGGNPRFVRHGERIGRFMIANACMHCVDPVCMIGCPTGAIQRAPLGQVTINDPTCIGCGTCAENCPYDNIRLVEVSLPGGARMVDSAGEAIVKATKCDLCIDQALGPACQNACPHDALKRVDMLDADLLLELVEG